MPLEEPITWRAIQSIKAMLQGIAAGDVYYTDIGAGIILDDRSQLVLSGEVATVITAGDFDENEDASGPRTSISSMDLTIEVAVPFGVDNAELVAHRAAADIRRALRTSLRNAPARFRKLQVTGTSFGAGTDDQGEPFTLAQVSARADLAEQATPA